MSRHPSNPDRSALLLAFALLVLLTLAMFASRPLTVVDETRYVGVAWEMWLRGDFLVPYKNGEPYSHKPPLLFWMIHAGWAVFGVNETWPRLVLPLFSAGSLWLTMALGRRLWPTAQVGGYAALILVASLLWALYSTALMFDVLLAFWVLVGLHGVLDAAAGRRRGVALVALAIGGGVLAKGPVILLHLLPVMLLARWWCPGLRWQTWLAGGLLALAGGALIALAWAIPAGLSGGDAYFNAIFWGQTADRVADAAAHPRPVGWYVMMLPVLLFPWFWWPRVWKALWALWRPVVAASGGSRLDTGTRFCLAWAIPVFVIFCFIGDKQPHYIAPLIPAFALLVARALGMRAEVDSKLGLALPAALVAAMGIFLMLVASRVITSEDLPALPLFWPGALLVALALASVLIARRVNNLAVLALLGAGGFGLMQLSASTVFAPMYDLKPLATTVHQIQNLGLPVANAATYHAQFQFAGRLEKPLVELPPGDEISWLATNPRAWVIVYLQNPEPPPVDFLRYQLYKGGALVLVDAKNAAHLLGGGVSGKAGSVDRD